jgi:hypothetical protein
MRWLNWLPWRFTVRYIARAYGFLDPMALLARLQHFAQPSELGEPIELLRAGAVFHARGLVNSRVVQHNLDWVWPYWIERQFDPEDEAFIPRAFSITHVNLTHRNWTAVGVPDFDEIPIVDPRGLLTAHYDGWSIDCWLIADDGRRLLPSRTATAEQRLALDHGLCVSTVTAEAGLQLTTRAQVILEQHQPVCRLQIGAETDDAAWLVVALRPYNPEGISFVHELELGESRLNWSIDDVHTVRFSEPVERHHVSDYRTGDVYIHLDEKQDQLYGECAIGMLTAAAMYRLRADHGREIQLIVPFLAQATERAGPTGTHAGVAKDRPGPVDGELRAAARWQESLREGCRLCIDETQMQFLYEAALRTVILHSSVDVYPGPYTYKRFWFRDAAFIVHALICMGLFERAERVLDNFPKRQTWRGYFHSQAGEWDANGEVLWILNRFCEMTNRAVKPLWRKACSRAARWIVQKRLPEQPDSAHAGLLPAGFSAEHLGPIDYYYWDDFWSLGGLCAAEQICGEAEKSRWETAALALRRAIESSLEKASARLGKDLMPAAPYRRMDAGAIGSLVAGYPLQLVEATDSRLLNTTEFLLEHCSVDNGFFQDMIHSGINPYLTLHLAQVLLRAGDPRYYTLMQTVARLASSTGQWPEAIHPRTQGGCMGDGQHVWAAAEWLVMIRNCFVREEGSRLVIGSGIDRSWLKADGKISFGPAPTSFGTLTIEVQADSRLTQLLVEWKGDWHDAGPVIEVCIPGYTRLQTTAVSESVQLRVDSP